MGLVTRIGTILGGAAWLGCGLVLLSFMDSPDAGETCHSDALWTGGWFFVPPLVAVVGLLLTLPRSPRRSTGLAANALLLGVWGFLLLPLYLLFAIGNGAACGGG